jgi:tRNA A-37 threonylcarbamoyl transferase component Bud32
MSERVHLREDLRDHLPTTFPEFLSPRGRIVARSASSRTERISLGGLALYRKHYVYPLRNAIKASLRNTLTRPSRVEREYRMLELFGERAGEDCVPAPAAFGERRSFLLLREAVLLTQAVEGGTPLDAVEDPTAEDGALVGRFIARLHRAGLTHGSLFPRNILRAASGTLAVLDLDRAQAASPQRLPPIKRRARDLAFLAVALADLPAPIHRRALITYARETGESARTVAAGIEAILPEARARLARRLRVR